MQPEPALVNGRFLARPVTGVERYAGEILARLGGRVRVARPSRRMAGLAGHAWEQMVLPGALRDRTTLWSPANTGPLRTANQVLTLHDLAALEHPEWFSPAFALWYRLLLPALVSRVRCVITPSQAVRQKVLRRFGMPPARVVVVPGGVDLSRFHPSGTQPDRGRTVLFVGSLEPRKNLPALLTAWKAVAPRHPRVDLVLAGTAGPVFRPVSLPGGVPRLRLAGYVSDAELVRLYGQAAVCVLPSFDEGFGLPLLEAMACGAPVIAANAGALPEVAGGAALLFDPYDPPALASALDQCLSSPDLARTLAQAGLERAACFSWSAAAETTLNLLEQAHGV